MSKFKIEKIPATRPLKHESTPMDDFIEVLLALKVGESFAVPALASNHRMAIAVLQYVVKGRFTAHKQLDGTFRVGRTS